MRTWFQIVYSFVSKYAAHHFKEHNYDVYDINRNTKPLIEGVTLMKETGMNWGKSSKIFILMLYLILPLMMLMVLSIYTKHGGI